MSGPWFIPFSFPGVPEVGCVFGTRLGEAISAPRSPYKVPPEVNGTHAEIYANKEYILPSLGLSSWQELTQVHGTEIVFPPELPPEEPFPPRGDGIGETTPGQGLIIKTADCQPIMVAHESGKFILAMHCGWRGNRAKFPESGIRKFCDFYHLLPRDLLAVRGPSLGPCCSRFHDFSVHWPEEMRPYFAPQSGCMDLWGLTRDQLLKAGILPENIFSLDLCTFCLQKHFFSYRRDKTRARMTNILWIKS